MGFALTIPRITEQELNISVNAGDALFVLGPNGCGKSALMHRFFKLHQGNALRIAAHRQIYFGSEELGLSPQQKAKSAGQIESGDSLPQAIWKDDYATQRPNISVYNLVNAETQHDKKIAAAARNNDLELVKQLAKEDGPIGIINRLFRQSSLPIKLIVQDNLQVEATRNGSDPYRIARLSDGERCALLIAADVLTSKPGSLILVDEPERHLHRSIISSLLTQLFSERPDCAFVVSTHEVMLPVDSPKSQALLLRDCGCTDGTITQWKVDLVQSELEIDNEIKKEILGARRKIVFIEGDEHSLDRSLYSIIFPRVSLVPKGSCVDVKHAVRGIIDAGNILWVEAFGIVDNDGHDSADIANLKDNRIYALTVFAVESIYYHKELQRRTAMRLAEVDGAVADIEKNKRHQRLREVAIARVEEARIAALKEIRPHAARLSGRVAEKAVRATYLKYRPTRAC